MAQRNGKFLELGHLDLLASQDTPIHRLDPRAKVVTVILYTLAVVSFDRHRIAALLPYLVFPVTLISVGNLPLAYLLRRVLLVLPFVMLVGIFNPLLDRQTVLHVGSLAVSGGWISFWSIALRCMLTVLTVLALIATTGFIGVCSALDKLGMPRAFSLQLLFLYRYLFVLSDEGSRMLRSRELRSFGRQGSSIAVFIPLVGHLLLRTFDRAQRIYAAMLARGFTGEFHLRHPYGLGAAEVRFVGLWSLMFLLFRTVDIPAMIGIMVTGGEP